MTFTWLVFIIQALISRIFLVYFGIDALPIAVIAITSLFLLFDLSRQDFSKDILLALFLAYLIRLFFLFFDLYGREIYLLPHSGLDSEMFHESTINGLLTGNYGNGSIYSFFVGTLYRMFGTERMISQFFNVLLSIHTMLMTYKTMELYKINEKAKYLSIMVLALIPNFAIMSSILLRESIIIFLYTLSFYSFSYWFVKKNVPALLVAYASGLLVSVFHSGSIILVMSYTIILILYNQGNKSFKITLKSIIFALTFAVIFNYLFQNYFEVFFDKFSDIEGIDDVTEVSVMGGSGYEVGYSIEHPILNFIVNTPIRIFYFIFSPVPWEWRGPTDIIAFIFSSLFYGSTLYLGFKSILGAKIENKSHILIILIILFVGFFVFAWGVSNSGTALRHRDKFIGLFILLLAFVLHDKESRGESYENLFFIR